MLSKQDIEFLQNNWVPDLDPEVRKLLEPKYVDECAESGHQLVSCNYCIHGE